MEGQREHHNKQLPNEDEKEKDTGAQPLKKRKLAELGDSDGEKKPAAKRDINDPSASVVRHEETPQALEQLYKAFDLIPDALKAAFLEARDRAPQVVEQESNPLWFLRFEQCNYWAASRRLATYWKERKDLFGDRAFLPLKDISGEGAMSKDDIVVLKSGVFAILPTDCQGGHVLYCDRTRVPSSHVAEPLHRFRAHFFFLTLLGEIEMLKAQPVGFAFVVLLSPKNPDNVHLEGRSRIVDHMQSAIPARLKKYHLVSCPPRIGRKTFMERIVPAAAVRLWGSDERTRIHIGDSPKDLCVLLAEYSMTPTMLPASLGGHWKYDTLAGGLAAPALEWTRGPEAASAVHVSGVADAKGIDQLVAQVGTLRSTLKAEKPQPAKNTHVECPSKAERACLELEKAINRLPVQVKAAYLEAEEKAPDLIESESDPFQFLHYDSYKADAAARRLVMYWEKRRKVFGERAFLPMIKTGQGALSEEDVALLDTGYLSLLPDDTNGSPVVLCDGSLLPSGLNDPNGSRRTRCAFYVLAALLQNHQNVPSDGFVGVLIASPGQLDEPRDYFTELVDETIVPLELKAFHLVHSPSDGGRKAFLETIVPATFKLFGGGAAYERTHVHTSNDKEDLLEKLLPFGFARECLPESIGGKWQYSKKKIDCDGNESLSEPDSDLEMQVVPMESSHASGATASFRVSTSLPNLETAVQAPAGETNAQARKRGLTIMYSRRKRERQKERLQALYSEKSRLEEGNQHLNRDNKYLEALLDKAQKAAFQFESTNSRGVGGDGSLQRHSSASLLPGPVGTSMRSQTLPVRTSVAGLDSTLAAQRHMEQQVLEQVARERISHQRLLLQNMPLSGRSTLEAQLRMRQQPPAQPLPPHPSQLARQQQLVALAASMNPQPGSIGGGGGGNHLSPGLAEQRAHAYQQLQLQQQLQQQQQQGPRPGFPPFPWNRYS